MLYYIPFSTLIVEESVFFPGLTLLFIPQAQSRAMHGCEKDASPAFRAVQKERAEEQGSMNAFGVICPCYQDSRTNMRKNAKKTHREFSSGCESVTMQEDKKKEFVF